MRTLKTGEIIFTIVIPIYHKMPQPDIERIIRLLEDSIKTYFMNAKVRFSSFKLIKKEN